MATCEAVSCPVIQDALPGARSASPAIGSITKAVVRFRVFVFIFWMIASAVGGMGAMSFIKKGSAEEKSGVGTRSELEFNHVSSLFPYLLTNAQYIAMLEAPEEILDVPGLSAFSSALHTELSAHKKLVSFQSNSSLFDQGIITSQLVSNDKHSTLLMWGTADKAESKEGCDFATTSKDILDRLVDEHLPGLISFTGLGGAEISIVTAEGKAMMEMLVLNGIAVPLALLVLLARLGSGRLLLLPLLSLSVAMSASMGIMFVLACMMPVQAICASFMTSIQIYVTFDYSLVILTRFQEELRGAGVTATCVADAKVVHDVVVKTMQSAGLTVLLSNIVLTVSFLTLAFSPSNVMSSVGLGCTITSLALLVVQFTYTPALLALFPRFFGSCLGSRCARLGCCASSDMETSGQATFGTGPLVAADAEAADTEIGNVRAPSHENYSKASRGWVLVAQQVSGPRSVIIVLMILVLVILSGRSLTWMEQPIEHKLQVTPRGTNAYESYVKTVDGFGAGQVNQFMVTLEPPVGETVFSEGFWGKSQNFVKAMASLLPDTDIDGFRFQSYANGEAVPWAIAEVCLKTPELAPGMCKPLQYLFDSQANADKSASFGYVVPKFDPVGPKGKTWLKNARDIADTWTDTTGMRVTIAGGPALSHDSISQIQDLFPWTIAATFGVTVLLLGAVLKSVVAPLLSIFASFLTVVTAYGLAVFIYQDGLLDGLNIPSLSGGFGALNWIIYFVAFSFVTSSSIGRSIMYLLRVAESRDNGAKTTAAAVEQSLCASGNTMVASGLATGILLGSGLFSSSSYVNCFAFIVGFASLFDALLIQCLVVPAASGFIGNSL